MAILNPPDVLPEAMRFIVRAILASPSGSITRKDLTQLVAPLSLAQAMESLGKEADPLPGEEPDGTTAGAIIVDASLAALGMLGVVALDAGSVRLQGDGASRWKNPAQVDATNFHHFLLAVILEVGVETSAAGSKDVADLIGAVDVLLGSENPLSPFDRFEEAGKGRALAKEFGARFDDSDRSLWPFPSEPQWQSFRRWSTYLGFARQVGGAGLIPDASKAVQAQLKLTPGVYPLQQFLAECAIAVPVLDGGALAQESRRRIVTGTELSPGLSVTLLQLEADGRIELSKLSDTDTLVIRVGQKMQAVSEVAWLEQKRPRKAGKR